jgi:peptidoglycan hydrolase-like protein with peptidoglycan-binding domain
MLLGATSLVLAEGSMTRLLREGLSGPDVRELQSRLNRAIPAVPSLKEDGIFGAKTKASLLAFQRAHGLKPDALYGPDTSAVLAARHVISGADLGRIEAIREWSATRIPPEPEGGG